MTALTPADVCRGLLAALDASEGRRKRRVRDTTADSIGLDIQRTLLAAAVDDAPSAEEFEGWLMTRCMEHGAADGGTRAMALFIWHQWCAATESDGYRAWLTEGAPSDDRRDA